MIRISVRNRGLRNHSNAHSRGVGEGRGVVRGQRWTSFEVSLEEFNVTQERRDTGIYTVYKALLESLFTMQYAQISESVY